MEQVLVNRKYGIKVEPLTPVSVGAGAEKDWSRGLDFVVKKQKIYLLDLQKILQVGINISEISALFARKDEEGLLKILGDKLEEVSSRIIDMPCGSNNDIKTFTKNQLKDIPIIPGSSLKGSIRSVLFKYLGGKDKDGNAVIGEMKDGSSFMRFVKIGDVDFQKTKLVNTKLFNLCQEDGCGWQGGWKHGRNDTTTTFRQMGFNTIYECVMPGMTGVGSLMLSDLQFGQVAAQPLREKKMVLMKDGCRAFFHIINQHTRKYLDKERHFFSTYPVEQTDAILESIDSLFNAIPSDDSSCVLKMSAGAGFHSITGDWQFDDYASGQLNRKKDGSAKPKSRKIAVWNNRFDLMGFVKISVLKDMEYDAWVEDNLKETKIKEEQVREAIISEKERVAALQAQKEKEVARKKEYDRAIEETNRLMLSGELDRAYFEAKKASELDPKAFAHIPLLKELEAAIKSRDIKNEAERIKIERERIKREEETKKLEGGLDKLLNIRFKEDSPKAGEYMVRDFKVCQQKVNSWLKSSSCTTLPQEQLSVLRNVVERLYRNPDRKESKLWQDIKSKLWRDIASWTSEETAAQWFEELRKSK